jgi:hypothetical protein
MNLTNRIIKQAETEPAYERTSALAMDGQAALPMEERRPEVLKFLIPGVEQTCNTDFIQRKWAEPPDRGRQRQRALVEEWMEAKKKWTALPEEEKSTLEAAAEAELVAYEKKLAEDKKTGNWDSVLNHWSKLLPPHIEIKTDAPLIVRLREIRNRRTDGDLKKEKALALFDTALDDFKKDWERKYYESLARCAITPRDYTPVQLSRIFSRTPPIDSGSKKFIDGIRAEIEGLPEPAPDAQMSKPPLRGIDDLISQGLLGPNGYRVIGDLNNVAAYLAGKKVNINNTLIKLYFRKSDGTEYSDSAITKAVNYANAQ